MREKRPPNMGEEKLREWIISILVDAECGCKEWPFPLSIGSRYPRIKVRGVERPCGRVVLRLLDSDLLALHVCDNTRCLNPDHLYAGTNKDNTSDMFARGRQHDRKAVGRACAKLTEESAAKIRDEYRDKKTPIVKLAKKYSVAPTTIWKVLSGQTWTSE